MYLKSPSLEEGSRMPAKHSLNGGNLSPELSWGDFPAGTKSFAVTCYDPDAPTGSGWWHWVALDIPSNVTTLAEGAKLAAPARELTTDYGTKGFGGACPPSGHGMHRYVFTVWALPVEKLDLPDGATAANAGFMLNAMAHGNLRHTVVPALHEISGQVRARACPFVELS